MFSGTVVFAQVKTTATSPNKNIQVNFWLNDAGVPMYEVLYKNKAVLKPSAMGFEIKQTMNNTILPSLKSKLAL